MGLRRALVAAIVRETGFDGRGSAPARSCGARVAARVAARARSRPSWPQGVPVSGLGREGRDGCLAHRAVGPVTDTPVCACLTWKSQPPAPSALHISTPSVLMWGWAGADAELPTFCTARHGSPSVPVRAGCPRRGRGHDRSTATEAPPSLPHLPPLPSLHPSLHSLSLPPLPPSIPSKAVSDTSTDRHRVTGRRDRHRRAPGSASGSLRSAC